MTLIVSVLSPQWVMQASDRRITEGPGADPRDGANKAVFAAERFVFAFTGRAEVDGAAADEWLQLTLARLFGRGMNAEDAFAEVALLLSGKISALPAADRNRALSIVGAGWSDESFAAREPLLVRISNLGDDSAGNPGEAAAEFAVSIDTLAGPYLVDVAGVGLKPEQQGSLEAQVDSLLARDEAALPVARAVVEMIRQRATDSDEVGRGVMLTNLPRAPGPPDGSIMLSGGWPEKSMRTFAYFHEQDKKDRWLAPLVVSSDGTALGDLVASGSRLAFPSFEPTPDSADMVPGMAYGDPRAPRSPEGAIGQAVRVIPKFGRNDPCWCESGIKFKKCHGA